MGLSRVYNHITSSPLEALCNVSPVFCTLQCVVLKSGNQIPMVSKLGWLWLLRHVLALRAPAAQNAQAPVSCFCNLIDTVLIEMTV